MNWKQNEILKTHVLAANKVLLPCPFCNGVAKIENTYTSFYWVQCKTCNTEMPAQREAKADDDIDFHIASIEAAMNKWNTRSVNDSMEILFNEIVQWQKETFPASNAVSKVLHLEDEVKELLESLAINHNDTSLEYADCFILLMGSADAYNMSFKDVFNSINTKMEINKARQWGIPDENGVVKHKKD